MHIRPARARDISDLATIATDALFDDELFQFLAPHRHQHPECLRLGFLRRTKKRFYDGHLVLAAVSDENDSWWDGEERLVGHLTATSSKQKEENESMKLWFSWTGVCLLSIMQRCMVIDQLCQHSSSNFFDLEEAIAWYTFADRSLSRSAWLQVLSALAGRGPLADVKACWDVDHVSVDPAHQGMGIGKALVKYVQAVAEKDGLPIILMASKPGRPMYKKMGFVDKGVFAENISQVHEAMVWYPPDVSSSDEAAKNADELSVAKRLM